MPNRPIWVLMTSDEEVGSLYSHDPIEAAPNKRAGAGDGTRHPGRIAEDVA